MLIWVFVLFALPSDIVALSDAEIEAAIHAGFSVRKIENAPLFRLIGLEEHKEHGYLFMAGACKEWISNAAFRSKVSGDDLDLESIRNECLGQDTVRIVVVSEAAKKSIESYAAGHFPVLPEPVTKMWVKNRKEIIEPIAELSDKFGEGSLLGVFPARLLEIQSFLVFIEIGEQHQLKFRIMQNGWKKVRRNP